jgi:hypothetical protein
VESSAVNPLDRLVGGLTRNVPVSALVLLGLGLMPLFGLLSAALLALVVLQRGYARSLLVLAAAMAGLSLVGWATGQGAWHVIWDPLSGPVTSIWLPAFLVAVVLRAWRSLPLAILSAGLLACLAVVAQLVLVADPVGLWHGLLAQFLEPLKQVFEARGPEAWNTRLDAMAWLMPGMSAASAMVGVSAMLLLARYFQARLTRPGAFGEEFRRFSLGLAVSLAGSLVFVARLLIDGPVLDSVAIVALGLFLFQGLAVIHALRHMRNWPRWGLVIFYICLALLPLWLLGLVSGAGLVDNWFDFRRLRSRTKA